jgi:hypothetical protein
LALRVIIERFIKCEKKQEVEYLNKTGEKGHPMPKIEDRC